jgi:transposase
MMRRRSDLPPADPQPWAQMIPADSFYARLAQWRDVLVDDEDYAPLYKDSPKGRPSIPPSMVVLAMLLEYHDDCSDAEAEQRMRFDLRWKHGLGLALEDEGFDATLLCRFRRKLLERGLERNLFERLVKAAREAGLIAKDATQLLDSSHILGAAGARDTYTLIRGAVRKLLRTLGHTTANRGTLGERLWWYMDPQAPEKPDIDWSDQEARATHLKEIVRDAREALSLAQSATGASPAANAASALLEKIVSDDVEEGPPPPPKRKGRPPKKRGEELQRSSSQGHDTPSTDELLGPRLRRGVAKDRVLSVVDPEMRVGHKSKRQAWAGYKVHIAEEPNTELITEVGVRRANEYDADAAPDLLKRQRESVGLRPKELLCDGAYGSADARAELEELGVEVVAKLTADFSVIDPYRMMRTGGSAEKSTRPIVHAWCMQVNINATRCRSRCWTRHSRPCPAALMLGRIEYDWVPKGETYDGYGTVRLLGAGSLSRSGVEGRDRFGRRRVNVEPVPSVLSALIWPPWDSAIWRAMESPRPAPPSEREGSALWKRSKMRDS